MQKKKKPVTKGIIFRAQEKKRNPERSQREKMLRL